MLKGLKEKRNQLIADLEMMVTAIETETRSLSDEEIAKFDAKKAEIEQIDKTIERVQEKRYKNMNEEQQVVEKNKVKKEEMEKRALDAFFRGEELDAEKRAMLTTNHGNKATIPLTIAEEILKKLEEQCPILQEGRRYSSKGTLRLLSETTYGAAAITEENTAFHNDDPELAFIELTSHKISTSVKCSFELLANSSVDMDMYLTDVIIRRMSRELNKFFLVGTGTKQPQGLIQAKNKVTAPTELTYDLFVEMGTSLHPDFMDKAKYIMNRKTFTKCCLLEDGNGHKYVQGGIVNGKFQYTLAGIPIIIDNNMPDYSAGNKAIILANIEDCYSINILQDIVLKRLDQVEFLSGVEVFASYMLADGKITNEDAILVAEVTPGKAAKVK